MKTVNAQKLIEKLVQDFKVLDVRAQIEFDQGSLPNSVCLPILNDQERAIIGTCYKQQGREKAINLGYKIVSDENKNIKIENWKIFFNKNPNTILTCFRGGLRSQITQTFLNEIGIDIQRIEGGYKSVRNIYMLAIDNLIEKKESIKILTGETGSGKTNLINEIKNKISCLDLEKHAEHRGSAFGKQNWAQPSQTTFENRIGHDALKILNKENTQFTLFEDESRVIGSVHLPEKLFLKMRSSKVVQIKENLENRIKNIFKEYVTSDVEIYNQFELATKKIEKKLGGLRTSEIIRDIQNSRQCFVNNNDIEPNKVWIEKMLVWYYDPMYQYSLKTRAPEIEFIGSFDQVKDYLVYPIVSHI